MTDPAALDRLLGMMGRWWAGWSLARIARECGVTRQRVATLLAQVGCTHARWCRADHEHPDSPRRPPRIRVAEARAALRHPLACRLTVRQRAALAWQAQGLVLVDIARRMGTTPQSVRHLQVAGRWRLDRLSKPKRHGTTPRSAPCAESGPRSPSDGETPALNWDGLMPSLGRPGTKDRGTGQETT